MPKKSQRGRESEEPPYRVPNFVKLYATNVKGGPTNQDFRFHVMNEKLKDENGWHFVSDAVVILTPVAAKNLKAMLDAYVAAYEQQHGPIETKYPKEQTY